MSDIQTNYYEKLLESGADLDSSLKKNPSKFYPLDAVSSINPMEVSVHAVHDGKNTDDGNSINDFDEYHAVSSSPMEDSVHAVHEGKNIDEDYEDDEDNNDDGDDDEYASDNSSQLGNYDNDYGDYRVADHEADIEGPCK